MTTAWPGDNASGEVKSLLVFVVFNAAALAVTALNAASEDVAVAVAFAGLALTASARDDRLALAFALERGGALHFPFLLSACFGALCKRVGLASSEALRFFCSCE